MIDFNLLYALIIAASLGSFCSLIISIIDHFTLKRKLEDVGKLVEEKYEETLAKRRQTLYDHGRRFPSRQNKGEPGKVHKVRIRSRLIRPSERREGFGDPTAKQ